MLVLDQIAKEVSVCTKCDLCKTRIKAVPGTGNPQAELVFIGEAPGANEDIQGKPFVGRAGELLSKALVEAGFDRNASFITNTVKCRPPQNRDPTEEEKAKCRPYLEGQLKAINPKTIVLLGRHAFMSILPAEAKKYPITQARGKIFYVDNRRYMPTFHPSAALYDPSKYAIIVSDLKQLRDAPLTDGKKTLFDF